MEAAGLRALALAGLPAHLHQAAVVSVLSFPPRLRRQRWRWRPSLSLETCTGKPQLSLHPAFQSVSSFSLSLSLSPGDESSGAAAQVEWGKLLQVVLVSPQIAGNTGCIARTCAASAVGLHLVEPLGYKVDDAKLKRAGLDYWPEYFLKQEGEKRLLAFTKRGNHIHSDFSYRQGDWLVFGSETSGLPAEALEDCSGGKVRIPMVETYVRCLNLSVSVGIALYEASRQLNYEQLQCPTLVSEAAQGLFISEDIYA
ncbi:unnamed protein product [Spirodela intermedia]|uniref:tRNA/rRNA methyltransferase SpoU type domain-containing protein n=1 Tax=Spirodela intermedia TaxID=51605 RepID=A0A7I8JQ87_SPIIN|nr:unnamed protein product [Spirodela intermedia]CAA6672327.1 unnamed protein product [Spirodela intermedia]